MGLVNLRELLSDAKDNGYAVPAFNVVNYLTTKSIIAAAENFKSPVIIQTSVSTVKAIGAIELISYITMIIEKSTVPAAVHLDHCTDADLAQYCADTGWTSIMIDYSKLDFNENLSKTCEIVKYCHGKNISVEGELGAIYGVEDEISVSKEDAAFADPDLSVIFCQKTGIDAFAPAIGTAHGLYNGIPEIKYDLLKQIADNVPCPTVIHGGTGLYDKDFSRCIKYGAAKINISTAIKIAYCDGINEYMSINTTEYNPLKLDKFVAEKVKNVAEHYMKVFGSKARG